MDITRENYEAYFIDYLEGTLDEKLVDRFIDFLQKNPDLKVELSLFEPHSAVPENTTFNKKDKLYKDKFDVEDEFNLAAVANLEGDISPKNKREFETYLSLHPDKQKDLKLFSKTVLKADKSILFSRKNKLYKKPSGKIVLFWAGRVAAVLILSFAIFSLLDKKAETDSAENSFAKVEKQKTTEKETETLNEKKEPGPIPEATKKNSLKPQKNDELPAKKTIKSIRENTKGRVEKKEVTQTRVPVETFAVMEPIAAVIECQIPEATLGIMTITYPKEPIPEEHLLADNLKQKFSLQNISKAGLNLVTSLSNERFKYKTNNEGKVTEYNYNSRLLAFSIPASRASKK